jgi:hypothetical protein
MKYRIEISGRGGEVAIGTVNREFYDLFQDNDDVEFDDYIDADSIDKKLEGGK